MLYILEKIQRAHIQENQRAVIQLKDGGGKLVYTAMKKLRIQRNALKVP